MFDKSNMQFAPTPSISYTVENQAISIDWGYLPPSLMRRIVPYLLSLYPTVFDKYENSVDAFPEKAFVTPELLDKGKEIQKKLTQEKIKTFIKSFFYLSHGKQISSTQIDDNALTIRLEAHNVIARYLESDLNAQKSLLEDCVKIVSGDNPGIHIAKKQGESYTTFTMTIPQESLTQIYAVHMQPLEKAQRDFCYFYSALAALLDIYFRNTDVTVRFKPLYKNGEWLYRLTFGKIENGKRKALSRTEADVLHNKLGGLLGSSFVKDFCVMDNDAAYPLRFVVPTPKFTQSVGKVVAPMPSIPWDVLTTFLTDKVYSAPSANELLNNQLTLNAGVPTLFDFGNNNLITGSNNNNDNQGDIGYTKNKY